MRILVLLLLAGTVDASETAIHNVTGYTSTDTGVQQFHVLVISADGKVLGNDHLDIRAVKLYSDSALGSRGAAMLEPYAGEALSRAEALHSFTLAAAFAAHQEERLGSLEPGKWADFIIVDRDFFTIPESEIDDIQVLETWVGGEQVYQKH